MFLIFMWLTTWYDDYPAMATKANFVLVMGILGLIGLVAWGIVGGRKLNITTNFSAVRLALTILTAMMIVGAAAGIWAQIQARMIAGGAFSFLAGQTLDVNRAFLVLIAVAEELFFNWGILLGLVVIFANRRVIFDSRIPFPGILIALVAASLIFAVFHGAVYGYTNALWLMFIYRMLMGGSYVMSGYLWGENNIAPAMVAHATINFLAAGGG